MASLVELCSDINMENLLKEAGIEDSIKNEIVMLLDGKHKKRDDIENKVFENLKKPEIFDKIFKRLLQEKKTHGLGDVQEECSAPEDVHYTTSFTETFDSNGGGDGKFSHVSSKANSCNVADNGKCSVDKESLLTSSSLSKKSFETKTFDKSVGNYDKRFSKTKSLSSSKNGKSNSEKNVVGLSNIQLDTTKINSIIETINERTHTTSKRESNKQNESQKRKSSVNKDHLSRNNNLMIKSSDERVLSSLSINGSKLTLGEYYSGNDNPLLIKLNPKKRHMHFEILSGKCFLEHLLEESFSMFLICLYFKGQRFWTQPTSCSSQPNFNAGFIFELHINQLGNNQMAEACHLLSIGDPIHLVLLRVLPNGDRILISSYYFEWRFILTVEDSQTTQNVELKGVGAESNLTIGIIDIRVTLIPKLKNILKNEDVVTKINSEKKIETEKNRIFLLYSKVWWKEYLALRPEHAQRTVKIFQQDENSVMRPVFQFIQEIKVGRPLLELPREAAWFVSLFLLESSSLLGNLPTADQWWDPFSFLCLKKGDCENHAALLCSLFLGFGIDAYVCIGSKEGNIPWAWVITHGRNNRTIFWESTTGVRYEHNSQKTNTEHQYRTVGCIFNHKSFYANIQESDKIHSCNFDLSNRKYWKNMSEAAVASVVKSRNISLMPGWTDPFLHSQDMETELRYLITDYRTDINLPTRWDIELCHLIAPFLSVYEMEHKMGIELNTEELDDMLTKNIPDGFAMKALPLRISLINNRRVLGFCLQNSVMKSIITCAESDSKLALKVHTYVYPENILSIWLIVACKYYTG